MRENIIDILDHSAEAFEQCQAPDLVDRASLKLRTLIEVVIQRCGKPVNLGEAEVELSWGHVLVHLEKYTPEGHHLYSHVVAVFAEKCTRRCVGEGATWKVDFSEDLQSARAFKLFLQHILPFENVNCLNSEGPVFYLTEEVMFFYSRFFCNEKGQLFSYYLHDALLKTLRADQDDFSIQFILGLIPGDNNKRRLNNLRPKNRSPYVVSPDGKTVLRLNREPMLTPKEKEGFTQAQSSTLINDIQNTPFGYDRGRSEKLYGLITDCKDAHIQRLLERDGGTVERVFESDSVKIYRSFFSSSQIRAFKENNTFRCNEPFISNEVLARLKFNPYRSVVCICGDTLESRLLAYDFANELWENYRDYAKEKGIVINAHYRIPIVFYLPREENPLKKLKHLRWYTEAQHIEDKKESYKIYRFYNDETRKAYYILRSFEFLLGLNEITLDMLKEEVEVNKGGDKIPLALLMMRSGYTRLLMRLLRPSRCDSQLKYQVMDYLLSQQLIKENDFVISELIIVEEFELADRLIQATGSQKNKLQKLNQDRYFSALSSHVIEKGNPRHMNYLGLESMLEKAAKIKHCSIIKLCLKEYNIENLAVLNAILLAACHCKEHTLAKMVLAMGASFTVESIVAVSAQQDMEMLKLIAQWQEDKQDMAIGGAFVMVACELGELDLALHVLSARPKPLLRHSTNLSWSRYSVVFRAIMNGHHEHDLLARLIDYELEYQDSNTLRRVSLEIIATYEVDVPELRVFLLEYYRSRIQIAEESVAWGVLFIENLQFRFDELVKQRTDKSRTGIVNLLKLQPAITEESAEHIAFSHNYAAIESILAHPETSDERKSLVIYSMITDFGQYMVINYIDKYRVKVNCEHLARASSPYSNNNYLMSFLLERYQVNGDLNDKEKNELYLIFERLLWAKKDLPVKLLRACGITTICEFVLTKTFSFFCDSYEMNNTDSGVLRSIRKKLYISKHSSKEVLDKPIHHEIIEELRKYFSSSRIHDEDLALDSLEKVFSLFRKSSKNTFLFIGTKKNYHYNSFNQKVYSFLDHWVVMLRNYKKELDKNNHHNELFYESSCPESYLWFGCGNPKGAGAGRY